jgi:hypothetical protein
MNSGWTAPFNALAGDGPRDGRFARFLTARWDDTTLLLAGNNVPTLFQLAPRLGTLVVTPVAQQPWSSPSGAFQFIQPQLAVGPDEMVQMLWGEQSESADLTQVDWLAPTVNEVWAANFRVGTGWSTPKRVYAGQVRWGKESTGLIASSHGRHALALAPSGGTDAQFDLIVLSSTGPDWTADTLCLLESTRPIKTSIVWQQGEISIAYLAAIRNGVRDRSSVWTISSASERKTWHPPVLVHQSGATPATYVAIVVDKRNVEHLVWHQTMVANAHEIRHASRTPGAAWSTPMALSLTGDFQSGSTAIDADGSIHVVFQDYPNQSPMGSLDHVWWTSGGWQKVSHLFPGTRGVDHVLVASDGGRLALVFLGQPSSAPPLAPYAAFVSFWEGRSSPF